jgi:4-hydroxy-tetrahydrodipicolinate synthase
MKALCQHPRIQALKDACGDIIQVLENRRLCPDIALYSGMDEMNLPILSAGGCGLISVVANVAPKACHDLAHCYLSGDTKGALALQLKMNPLIQALFCETSPIPVKTALGMMGLCGNTLRLPLCPMEDANLPRLRRALEDFGLL